MRITVVASMRNEGPFIVEWVTWYRMLGFSDILVVTNNCTDHSPDLLDALQAAGWAQHMVHDIPVGKKVTHPKLNAAAYHKVVRRADWLLVCDVDEFLVIHKGTGRIHELLGKNDGDAPFLAMAFNWRVFGFSGVKHFEDRPVHQQFSLAQPVDKAISSSFKMIHRQPRWFRGLGEHGPRGQNLHKYGRDKSDPDMILVNAKGDAVTDWDPDGPYLRRLPEDKATHKVAQMNHYMLRSVETFSLKQGTPSPVARSDRYNERYVRQANGGDEPDMSAFRYADDFAALHQQAMALPGVARLHALCCADHLRLIAEKHGRNIQEDPRWHQFMAQAEASEPPSALSLPASSPK